MAVNGASQIRPPASRCSPSATSAAVPCSACSGIASSFSAAAWHASQQAAARTVRSKYLHPALAISIARQSRKKKANINACLGPAPCARSGAGDTGHSQPQGTPPPAAARHPAGPRAPAPRLNRPEAGRRWTAHPAAGPPRQHLGFRRKVKITALYTMNLQNLLHALCCSLCMHAGSRRAAKAMLQATGGSAAHLP